MVEAPEIVITGLGVVSPLGTGLDAFHQALVRGASGVRTIAQYDPTPRRVRIGAELPDFDPKLYVQPRKSLKVMSREIQIGFAAANLAVEHAGLTAHGVNPDRLGVIFGSQMLYGEVEELADLMRSCLVDGEFDFQQFGQQFSSQLFPLWMLKYLPNMTASHIGIAHDARGPNNSIVLGEASGLLAVMEAITVIQRGWAEVMLTGGGGSRLALTPLIYRGDINLSHRNDDPATASRPFDMHRDGMVNGEGAGALVIETRAHAEARGAHIFGRFLGFGCTHPGNSNSVAARRQAVAASIARALDAAGLEPRAIGHVNAHGLSTLDNDQAEAQAVRLVLGDVPVTALKSYFGNLGPGGGIVELVASLLSLRDGLIYPHRNLTCPDPACPIQIVRGRPRSTQNKIVMKLSQSGTGQAAAIIVEAA
jgi:3-oxoacyl-[acyl-carrier-protein] synthase II